MFIQKENKQIYFQHICRQGQLYLIFTNFLFFIFGCALLSFGMMAIQLKISIAILIPINILKSMNKCLFCKCVCTIILYICIVINILGIILIFSSLIGLLGSFYREKKSIHFLCTAVVVIAFAYQVSIAVIVYKQAAHTTSWISQTWAEASSDYRLYAQTKVIALCYSVSFS